MSFDANGICTFMQAKASWHPLLGAGMEAVAVLQQDLWRWRWRRWWCSSSRVGEGAARCTRPLNSQLACFLVRWPTAAAARSCPSHVSFTPCDVRMWFERSGRAPLPPPSAGTLRHLPPPHGRPHTQGALKELQARHEAELKRSRRKARGAQAAVAQLTEEVADLKVRLRAGPGPGRAKRQGLAVGVWGYPT